MLDLLVIQPTPFCNINCTYCYLPDRANTKKITVETLEKIISALHRDDLLPKSLSVVWHAGEPLTIQVDYFAGLLQLMHDQMQNVSVSHSIQTNGMLITQEWCDLIKKFDIRIGISLDGPKEINDSHRTTRKGSGTFEKTMTGVQMLRKNGIPYHAIAVITQKSLDCPDAIFEFFRTNGFTNLGLNVEEIEGSNADSSLSAEKSEKIKMFWKRIFELYTASDKCMSVREFDNSLNTILRNPDIPDITRDKVRSHQTEPLAIISVDYLGNFSTFSPELLGQKHNAYGDFNLGNVYTDSFVDALTTRKFKTISEDISKGIKRCRQECGYFYLCGGGAPANKLYENGSFNSTETMYCRNSIQAPMSITLDYLENAVRDNQNV